MGAKKDPLRPKPGKYYKYKKTVKFYIHCGVISKSNNMWGFIGETGNGKWLFFPEQFPPNYRRGMSRTNNGI